MEDMRHHDRSFTAIWNQRKAANSMMISRRNYSCVSFKNQFPILFSRIFIRKYRKVRRTLCESHVLEATPTDQIRYVLFDQRVLWARAHIIVGDENPLYHDYPNASSAVVSTVCHSHRAMSQILGIGAQKTYCQTTWLKTLDPLRSVARDLPE
jgi:hypothetical protein